MIRIDEFPQRYAHSHSQSMERKKLVSIVCALLSFVLVTTYVLSYREAKMHNQTDIRHLAAPCAKQRNYTTMAFDVGPHDSLPNTNLPNLRAIGWPVEQVAESPAGWSPPRNTTGNSTSPNTFEPNLSRGQRRLLYKLLTAFALTMTSAGLNDRWYMCAGTLLGSFRHHDMIPWDDDVDVCVDVDLRSEVLHALSKLPAELFQVTSNNDYDKLHTPAMPASDESSDKEASRAVTGYAWPFPFIDIFYYRVSAGLDGDREAVATITELVQPFVTIAVDHMMPFHYRPLGRAWYPAPRDTEHYLTSMYNDLRWCTGRYYNHAAEVTIKSTPVECSSLTDRFAFAESYFADEHPRAHNADRSMTLVNECLVIGGHRQSKRLIHSLMVAIAA